METPPIAPLRGREEVDLAVVGAGLTGLSAAIAAREAGMQVCVLEASQPGDGASGLNAGQWLPGWVGRTPASVVQEYGELRGGALNRFNVLASQAVPRLTASLGAGIAFRHCGVLQVAAQRSELRRLQGVANEWQRAGACISCLDRPQLAAHLATDHYIGGVLFHDAGWLNPLSLVRALAAQALRRGVKVFAGSPVAAIGRKGPGWMLSAAEGAVESRQALIATDASWAPSPFPTLDRSCWRVSVPMFASGVLTDSIQKFLPRRVPFAQVLPGGLLFGGMIDGDGRFIASGPPAAPFSPAGASGRWIAGRLRMVFREMPPVAWRSSWSGVVGISRNRLPQWLELAPGLTGINGFSGGGIALATALGRAIGLRLAAGDPSLVPLPLIAPRAVAAPRLTPLAVRGVAVPIAKWIARARCL